MIVSCFLPHGKLCAYQRFLWYAMQIAVSVNHVDAEHLSILMGVFSLTNHHITNMCDMLRVVRTYSLVASSEEVMGMIISNTNAYGIGAVHR